MSEELSGEGKLEEAEETREELSETKKEIETAGKPRYTFELEERDREDALKMSNIIKKNHSLSRSTPAFVAKFLFMETLKEYRKAGLI